MESFGAKETRLMPANSHAGARRDGRSLARELTSTLGFRALSQVVPVLVSEKHAATRPVSRLRSPRARPRRMDDHSRPAGYPLSPDGSIRGPRRRILTRSREGGAEGRRGD